MFVLLWLWIAVAAIKKFSIAICIIVTVVIIIISMSAFITNHLYSAHPKLPSAIVGTMPNIQIIDKLLTNTDKC